MSSGHIDVEYDITFADGMLILMVMVMVEICKSVVVILIVVAVAVVRVIANFVIITVALCRLSVGWIC